MNYKKYKHSKKVGLIEAGATLIASVYLNQDKPLRSIDKITDMTFKEIYQEVAPIANATAAYLVAFGLSYGFKKD